MPSARQILSVIPFINQVRRGCRGQSYLVGGAVRDAFLGRSCTDFDFLAENPTTAARAVAKGLRGRTVRLHKEHDSWRVVVGTGQRSVILDFAAPRTSSLLADLRARDFTMNAMAAGPLGSRPRLFDPCAGRADIARRLVCMTSPSALASDPVRIVRAYRFAAMLGFAISPGTRACCHKLAGEVNRAAAERLGAELLLLLSAESYETALTAMADDGVLGALIPELKRAVGVEQGGVHEFDVATHSVLAAKRLAEIMSQLDTYFPQQAGHIKAYLSRPEMRAGLVLATLLHDIGKPERRTWDGTRWRFFGHESHGAELADVIVSRLRLSRKLRRQVKLLVASHMRLLPFMQSDEPTQRARRRLMRDLAPHGIGAILLALADRHALCSQLDQESERAALQRLRMLLDTEAYGLPSQQEEPPIRGDDLIQLGLIPGPLFREILRAVEERWVRGELTGREEALEWVRTEYGAPESE